MRAARAAGALLAAAALLYAGQPVIERYFIYFPARQELATPADVGLDFEDVVYIADDGTRLHGWFVPGSRPETLLWFHGNAGNISHRVDMLKLLHDDLGTNVFIAGYRGYGRNPGVPSEEGLYLDAQAALDAVARRADTTPDAIVYFGQSLGAAVAVDLATRQRPAGLILEAAFTSVADMASHHYRWLPVGPFLRTRYDSASKMDELAGVPLLMIHGERDDIVPLEMGRRLYARATGDKRLVVIDHAGHNDTVLVGRHAYLGAIEAFLDRIE